MAQVASTSSDPLDVHFGPSFGNPSSSNEGVYAFRCQLLSPHSWPQPADLPPAADSQKPHSLDPTKPGTLSVHPSVPDSLYATFPSTAASGPGAGGARELDVRFSGQATAAKEVECVLIWDEGLQVRLHAGEGRPQS